MARRGCADARKQGLEPTGAGIQRLDQVTEPLIARCGCAAHRLRIEDQLQAVRYCHCANCRKFSGTSPALWAMVRRDALRVERADSPVGRFNSGRGVRCFCTRCGTPLWFESLDYPHICGLPLGALDAGIPVAQLHLWWDSKPAWCVVTDDLPRHAQGPESL